MKVFISSSYVLNTKKRQKKRENKRSILYVHVLFLVVVRLKTIAFLCLLRCFFFILCFYIVCSTHSHTYMYNIFASALFSMCFFIGFLFGCRDEAINNSVLVYLLFDAFVYFFSYRCQTQVKSLYVTLDLDYQAIFHVKWQLMRHHFQRVRRIHNCKLSVSRWKHTDFPYFPFNPIIFLRFSYLRCSVNIFECL